MGSEAALEAVPDQIAELGCVGDNVIRDGGLELAVLIGNMPLHPELFALHQPSGDYFRCETAILAHEGAARDQNEAPITLDGRTEVPIEQERVVDPSQNRMGVPDFSLREASVVDVAIDCRSGNAKVPVAMGHLEGLLADQL